MTCPRTTETGRTTLKTAKNYPIPKIGQVLFSEIRFRAFERHPARTFSPDFGNRLCVSLCGRCKDGKEERYLFAQQNRASPSRAVDVNPRVRSPSEPTPAHVEPWMSIHGCDRPANRRQPKSSRGCQSTGAILVVAIALQPSVANAAHSGLRLSKWPKFITPSRTRGLTSTARRGTVFAGE